VSDVHVHLYGGDAETSHEISELVEGAGVVLQMTKSQQERLTPTPVKKSYQPTALELENFQKSKAADRARRTAATERRKYMQRFTSDLSEKCRELVKSAHESRVRAAQDLGGLKIAAKSSSAQSDAIVQGVTGSTSASGLEGAIQMALRGEDVGLLVNNGRISADDASAIQGAISPQYLSKCIQINRLEKHLQSGASRMTDETRASAGEQITHHRIEQAEIGRQIGEILRKGMAQDALGGTNTPEVGPAMALAQQMGRSGLAGPATGLKPKPSDSALVQGGESPYSTIYDSAVQTNPQGGVTDGWGIVNPQAIAKACAELNAETDPNRRARLGERVTALRLGHSGVGLTA
jgi:hypothetical protein